MSTIEIWFLLSIAVFNTFALRQGDEISFFHKPILNEKDALDFRLDTRSTVGRVTVQEDKGDNELYVVIKNYTIRELIRDTGKKRLNVIFKTVPQAGWEYFYKVAKGNENRIFIEIHVARGVGVNSKAPVVKSLNHPPEVFQYSILSFVEVEDYYNKYTEMMLMEMSKRFEETLPIKFQWLRLNAYHIKNIRGFKVHKKLFKNLRHQLIIYQNYSRNAIKQEDVVGKLRGFESDDIFWDNVESGLVTYASRFVPITPPTDDGNCTKIFWEILLMLVLMWFYFLMF